MSISITRYYVAVLSIVIIFSTDCVFMCMCYIGEVFGYFCLFPKSSDADLSRKAFELQSSSLVIFTRITSGRSWKKAWCPGSDNLIASDAVKQSYLLKSSHLYLIRRV